MSSSSLNKLRVNAFSMQAENAGLLSMCWADRHLDAAPRGDAADRHNPSAASRPAMTEKRSRTSNRNHPCGVGSAASSDHDLVGDTVGMFAEATCFNPDLKHFFVKQKPIWVSDNRKVLAAHGAASVAESMRKAVAKRGRCRMVISAGTSEAVILSALAGLADAPWSETEVFLTHEFVGLPRQHPASCHHWLQAHLGDRLNAGHAHSLDGAAADPVTECARYGDLLSVEPIDIGLLGIGDDGQIACNAPCNADFRDPRSVKVVRLDEAYRRQLVGEGFASSLPSTPTEAMTLTCQTLIESATLFACASGFRRANAVRDAIENRVSPQCPASLIFEHANAQVFLDGRATALLSQRGAAEG